MAQFMTIANIKGNVTSKSYEGAIQIHGIQHTNHRHVSQKVGSSNCDIGIVNTHHIQITKDEDASSTQLYQAFYQGKVIPKIEIDRCSLLSGNPEWQSKVILTNVMISSIVQHASNQGARELITLSFNKIERSFRGQSSSGSWQTAKRMSYDIATTEVG